MLKNLKINLISTFCLLVAACAPPVTGFYHDPSFSYGAIYRENIGVGGVASSVHPLNNAQRNLYSNLLRNKLMARYPSLDVMPMGDTVRALGNSTYRIMMRDYRQTGVVDTRYLNLLKQQVHRLRYVVFARITEQNITHDLSTSKDNNDYYDHHHHHDYDHHDDYDHHRHGGGHVVTETTTLNTHLTARAEIVVYDLQTGRYVWTGNTEVTKTNSYSSNDPIYQPGRHASAGDVIAGAVAEIITDAGIKKL
ncbi:MAG: hypothetical protein JW855_03925, partial [Gammaproteobacteria bacterium]|nr:hypothetical protein [Gammaproteobacteria bacterium]